MPSMSRHAHRHQRGTIAVMEVEIVELRPLPLFYLQTQGRVERLFAGSADPEIPSPDLLILIMRSSMARERTMMR